MGPKSSLPPPIEEPERLPVDSASVARDYFIRELEAHQQISGVENSPNTVVILQDDCYGHRYSRPRTSRASLGTIVERPERIHASILGLASAYVRGGGRHAEAHAAPHPKRKIGSLASMPFRIHKTNRRISLTSQAAASIHGAPWMGELKAMCDAAESKLATTGKELVRTQPNEQGAHRSHTERSKLHEGDLYLCSGSLEALEGAVGGVCEAVDAVFKDSGPRRAFVCIRPPGHHCSADMPSGFCWVNNVHIGIDYATRTHDLTHAAIIDFDLHHGDGSQSITWNHNARVTNMPKNTALSRRTAIGYFSLHDINSYPCEMGDEDKVKNASLCVENAHGQTIWNVHLQPWKTEEDFWKLYQDRYTAILSKARSFLRSHTERLKHSPLHPRPKAAIFLSAGFDASEWESPGMQRHQVNVPTSFYARFTRDVVAIADEEGLGVDGRVISVLEGGYSDRALMSGVLSHVSGLTSIEIPKAPSTMSNGLGHEMSQRLGKLEINGHARHGSGSTQQLPHVPLDPDWWSLPCLEEIEKLVYPQPNPAAPPKKVKSTVPTNYSSATQSFTAKIISAPPNRRSVSGSGATYITPTASSPRAPSPPPPAVDWATAAHELSKILVPSDRQTLSCKPEDLNAEATRARRDRQSNIGLPIETPTSDGKRMQLRDRRGKPPKYASDEDEEKPISRANRRKTMADATTLPMDTDDPPPISTGADVKKPPKPKARRSSMASNVSSVSADKPSPMTFANSTVAPPTQNPAIIKKPRPANSTQVEPSKPRVTKPKPPVPTIPAAYTNHAGTAPSLPSPDNVSVPLTENDELKNRDVDQLASGMKKMNIKLNVPSKEEQKVREAKRVQAAPKAKPKTIAAKTAQAKESAQKSATAQDVGPKSPSNPLSKDGRIRVQDLLAPSDHPQATAGAQQAGGDTTQFDSRSTSNNQDTPLSLPTPTTDPAPPSFLPPVAPAIPAPAPSTQDSTIMPPPPLPPALSQAHEPLTSGTAAFPPTLPQQPHPPPLAPPSAPATPKHTKQELPVFTSTSPILFGKAQGATPGIDQSLGAQRSTVSASEKPQIFDKNHGNVKEEGEGQDIFDVPATPYHSNVGGTKR
ncbi:MAG: hypothetical protein Q9222_007188 [Ikaeria aurantiellina]